MLLYFSLDTVTGTERASWAVLMLNSWLVSDGLRWLPSGCQ